LPVRPSRVCGRSIPEGDGRDPATRDYGADQRAQGKAEAFAEQAKAAAILAVLSARGVPVSDEARARIEACGDVAILDRWILRAVTVPSTEEVFATASERT